MKRLAVTAIVACVCWAPALAQAKTGPPSSTRARALSRLNRVVSNVERLNIPGGVIGVSDDGIGNYRRAFGIAAPGVPMTLGSEFRVASITKTFTATVILELVDRGKLKLNQSIARWEPRLRDARFITIANLLNMTSSIYDEGGPGSLLSQWIVKNCTPPKVTPACSKHYWSPQSIVDLAIRQGPQFAPGVYSYSDTNYVLLAMIAQDVTHKPFAILLKRMIFKPLHLRHTFFPTRSTTMPAPATAGYQIGPAPAGKGKQPTALRYTRGPQMTPSVLFGAGAIVTNLSDLQTWARALAVGSLLTPKTQRLRLHLLSTGFAFSPLGGTGISAGMPVSYGLGIASLGGLLGHNGAEAPWYTSEMWYSRRRHGSVVVLYNSYTPCITPGHPAAGTAGELADTTAVSLARIAYGSSTAGVAGTPLACLPAQPLGGG